MSSTPAEASDRFRLANLPLDLVFEITDYLPASSVACLSLTCKSLYYCQPLRDIWIKELDTTRSRWLRTGCSLRYAPHDCSRDDQYLEFVRMLRRDIHTHLLGDCCNKFHPKLLPKASRPGMEWVTCPRAPLRGSCISWPKFKIQLQFEDVQMVMNRHRWGGRHGASLSSIAISTDWDVNWDTRCGPVLCKFDLEPEIVDHGLVLHTTQRLFITRRQVESKFETLVDNPGSLNTFKVCKHHSILAKSISPNISRWLRCYYHRRFDHKRRWKRSALTWCGYCSTFFFSEAVFIIDAGPETAGREGLEITLHSWMLLGTCEDTFSSAWFHISEQRGVMEPRYGYPLFLFLRTDRITLDMFRIMLPRVQTQYSQKLPCFETFNHPSLLPAITRAVALLDDAFEAKYHEFTTILQAAGHRTDRLDMKFLVDTALQERSRWYKELVRSNQPEHVRTAMRIIHEHRCNNAEEATSRLKRFGYRVLARLSRVSSHSTSKKSEMDLGKK